jgi:hypothetical protein
MLSNMNNPVCLFSQLVDFFIFWRLFFACLRLWLDSGLEKAVAKASKHHQDKLARDADEAARMNNMIEVLNIATWPRWFSFLVDIVATGYEPQIMAFGESE